MAKEIERRFLVTGTGPQSASEPVLYRQGYLCAEPGRTVRVRTAGDRAFLTVKGETRGATREEFEYEIPFEDAEAMLRTLVSGSLVEKYRRTAEYAGMVWVIDEFIGRNAGLVLAEAELECEDQDLPLPPWAGREVTADARCCNACLARHPYDEWKNEDPTE